MSGIIADNVGRNSGLMKAAAGGGTWTKISTVTASTSSTISFTSGIDSTYDIYCFEFINLHPVTDDVKLVFQASTDGGSSYNTALTNTYWLSQHTEGGSDSFTYSGSDDQANGTSFQRLNESTGSDNDQSICGSLCLYAPSSTTFVKNFMSITTSQFDRVTELHNAGYFNTTSSIDAVQIKFDSGAIQSGDIALFGIS